MDERTRGYHLLKEYFDRKDMDIIQRKGLSVFNTEYGIFGSSSLPDLFELFTRIQLHKRKRFIDLGSGDGRIALLAALFTDAVGIEGDGELHGFAAAAKEALKDDIPSLARCTFTNADYTQEDLSGYEILFIYADHDWPAPFQEKLLKECRGTMLCLHNIFSPSKLKKGKTYWVGQAPFVSYPLNVDELLDAS